MICLVVVVVFVVVVFFSFFILPANVTITVTDHYVLRIDWG